MFIQTQNKHTNSFNTGNIRNYGDIIIFLLPHNLVTFGIISCKSDQIKGALYPALKNANPIKLQHMIGISFFSHEWQIIIIIINSSNYFVNDRNRSENRHDMLNLVIKQKRNVC